MKTNRISNLCILVIEDNDSLQELIVDTIKENFRTATILSAFNPVEALDLFQMNQAKITHIICDYFLPIENGKDLIKIIKEHNSFAKICFFSSNYELLKNKEQSTETIFLKENGVEQIIDFLKK